MAWVWPRLASSGAGVATAALDHGSADRQVVTGYYSVARIRRKKEEELFGPFFL